MITELWHRVERGTPSLPNTIRDHVRRCESEQAPVFERFIKLEALYDPYGPDSAEAGEQLAHVQENVIASNVDAIHAAIATANIRARFMTDGADWAQQRRARHLEWYSEELVKEYEILQRCRSAFKECAKKGTGLVKVTREFDDLKVRHVLVENIVVNPAECRDGRSPREMHEWVSEDADTLIARFPKHKDAIENWRKSRDLSRYPRKFLQVDIDVEYLESFRLSIGTKGRAGYVAGRHTILCGDAVLLDEVWEEGFPYAVAIWSERTHSFYGISGAERIAGIQRALNKRNWQIEMQNDRGAMPTTYVRPVDAKLAVTSQRPGAVAVCKGDWPVTVTPPAVSPETYQNRIDLRESANNEFGQSQMATHASKPAGIDSGVALREYKDQSSQRFASQEDAFERLVIRAIELAIGVCKELGAAAPTMQRKSRFGLKRLPWKSVDMKDVRVQIMPASNLGRTPSGRFQFVMELAQAGIISTDSARRLLQHPDLEGELSLYTAALEDAEFCFDEIADGKRVMPEPFMNLEMVVWRGQSEYLKWKKGNAPERVIERLRQFVVQAAWIDEQGKQPANANVVPVMPGDVGAAPPMPGAEAMPGLPGGAPAAATPAAALSPQAMMLRAG